MRAARHPGQEARHPVRDLRRGVVYKMGQMLVVGTLPPTPIQQQVMDGVAAAHPWFRDPMRSDPMAAFRALTTLAQQPGTFSTTKYARTPSPTGT